MPWASCQIRNIAGCACAGNAGNVFPAPTSKETACYRSRHASRHVCDARAVMHVGIANPRWPGKSFPAFPAHAQPTTLRIWQEAHAKPSPLSIPFWPQIVRRNHVRTIDHRDVTIANQWGNNKVTFRILKTYRKQPSTRSREIPSTMNVKSLAGVEDE